MSNVSCTHLNNFYHLEVENSGTVAKLQPTTLSSWDDRKHS